MSLLVVEGVEEGFRDDEHITVIVNNRLLDQIELFPRSHWADIKMSDSNVDLSVGFFLKTWEAQGSILGRGLAEKQGKCADRIAVQKVAEH